MSAPGDSDSAHANARHRSDRGSCPAGRAASDKDKTDNDDDSNLQDNNDDNESQEEEPADPTLDVSRQQRQLNPSRCDTYDKYTAFLQKLRNRQYEKLFFMGLTQEINQMAKFSAKFAKTHLEQLEALQAEFVHKPINVVLIGAGPSCACPYTCLCRDLCRICTHVLPIRLC